LSTGTFAIATIRGYNACMKLVSVTNFGIKGINYYWERRDKFNLSAEELASVGVLGNIALVEPKLIPKLTQANRLLKEYGYEIVVKDAYRSPELYNLVRKKRYEIDGKINTDRTLSTGANPHSSGKAVDINLIELRTGLEVEIWGKSDWPNGVFINYYRNKKDKKSKNYQSLQDLLQSTMTKVGFSLGKRREFHHFELK